MTKEERAPIDKFHLLPPLTGACEASGTVMNAVTGQPLAEHLDVFRAEILYVPASCCANPY